MSITYKEYNEQYRLPEQEQAEKLLMKHKHFVLVVFGTTCLLCIRP